MAETRGIFQRRKQVERLLEFSLKPKEMDLATKFLILFFTVATLLPFSAKAAVQTKRPSFI